MSLRLNEVKRAVIRHYLYCVLSEIEKLFSKQEAKNKLSQKREKSFIQHDDNGVKSFEKNR